MKVQLALIVFVISCLTAACSTAQGYTIQNYLDMNCVTSIDYRDGTLAVGTARGLVLMKDGQMRMLTADDGLPRSYIPRVAVSDADTIYVGAYHPDIYPADEPQRVYEVQLQGQGLTVREITGDHEIKECWQVFDTGPDGSLWLADRYGIHRYDGAEWHVYHHERYGDGYMGSVFFARDGTAYFMVYCGGGVFRVAGDNMAQLPMSFYCCGIALDADDVLWGLGESETAKGLFRFDGAEWQLVSDDPVWSEVYLWLPYGMFFDKAGRLWVIQEGWIALYEDGEVTVFDQADGLAFKPSWAGGLFSTSYEAMPDGTAIFGTLGAGLLTYDDGGFGRIYLQDALQGYRVEDILEDDSGSIWVLNSSIRTVSVLKSGHWSQMGAPWFGTFYGGPYMAKDVNGDIWMTSDSGAARWDGSEFEAFDMSNSPVDSSYAVAIDSLGKKWFASPMGRRPGETATGAVVSFDGVNWQRYPSDEFFLSQRPVCAAVGPGDKLWFTRYFEDSHELRGFTTYDGETWEHLDWHDLPVLSWTVRFDINGNALLPGNSALYRCYPSGDWEWILDAHVYDVQSDTDGRLYCAATDGLYFGEKDKWEKITREDGLCSGWDAPAYSSSYPINAPLQVLIDHDGDKWIGTETGLSLLRDDGPAAQKLTLKVIVGHSQGGEGRTLLLSGEFINTYTTMPVSLWLACEFGGGFYFYPDWGAAMQSVDIVLPAHSIEARELCSFDADSLPPGSYTFIGGISLRGGAHLMIGARDDKYSFATWVND